jgi:hypothetical protein
MVAALNEPGGLELQWHAVFSREDANKKRLRRRHAGAVSGFRLLLLCGR